MMRLRALSGSRIIIAGAIIAVNSHFCTLIQVTIMNPRRVISFSEISGIISERRKRGTSSKAPITRASAVSASRTMIDSLSPAPARQRADCPTVRTREKRRSAGGEESRLVVILKSADDTVSSDSRWVNSEVIEPTPSRCTDTACTWLNPVAQSSLFLSHVDACQNRLFRLSWTISFVDLLSNFNKHALQTEVCCLKHTSMQRPCCFGDLHAISPWW